MALPARVNLKAAATWTSATGTTFSSGTQSLTAGNTLVVAVGGLAVSGQSVVSLADTAGNTFTKVDHVFEAADNYRVEIWYAKNVLGHATNNVTATWSAVVSYRGMVVVQYAGLSTTTPFDATAKGTVPTPASSVTTATLTTTGYDEIHVLIPRWGLLGTTTFPTGFTQVSSDVNALLADAVVVGAPFVGTYTITHSVTASAKTALVASFAVPQVLQPGRVTQAVVETLSLPVPAARVTQHAVELLTATTPIPGHVTQYVVEVLSGNPFVGSGERVETFVWGPL